MWGGGGQFGASKLQGNNMGRWLHLDNFDFLKNTALLRLTYSGTSLQFISGGFEDYVLLL